jgi:hypothetical protein
VAFPAKTDAPRSWRNFESPAIAISSANLHRLHKLSRFGFVSVLPSYLRNTCVNHCFRSILVKKMSDPDIDFDDDEVGSDTSEESEHSDATIEYFFHELDLVYFVCGTPVLTEWNLTGH